jgi:hypothetical protein
MSTYQIADEPAPGALARFAVNPLFPFLAFLLGGLWIAWPWFAFNGIAVGSPTWRREWLWLGGSILVISVLLFVLTEMVLAQVLVPPWSRYAGLTIPLVKLATLYAVFVLQSRTIEIYEYYGGVLRNGVFVLAAILLLRPGRVMEELPLFFQLLFA